MSRALYEKICRSKKVICVEGGSGVIKGEIYQVLDNEIHYDWEEDAFSLKKKSEFEQPLIFIKDKYGHSNRVFFWRLAPIDSLGSIEEYV
jgi:hypothetical protein